MDIAGQIADLRQEVVELKRATRNIPIRVPSGGGPVFQIREYDALPAVPNKPRLCSQPNGDAGLDQLHYAEAGFADWEHVAILYSKAGSANLPAVTAPAIGYDSTGTEYYGRCGSAWSKLIRWFTSLSGITAPALGYHDSKVYCKAGSDEICLSHLE